jgi:hypothetical protein
MPRMDVTSELWLSVLQEYFNQAKSGVSGLFNQKRANKKQGNEIMSKGSLNHDQ